jgi:hypothetical protein
VITGKTYFISWSMDVKIEGQNVDRHTDMTTSNHASPMANTFVPNLNSAKMGLGKTSWDNQTCREEVLKGVQGRKDKIQSQLKASENCNPKDNAKGMARQAGIPCSALKKRVKVQTKLLAAREEKQAKCFNDPSKDKKPEEKKARTTHEQQIKNTKESIANTKARARINCAPGAPTADL